MASAELSLCKDVNQSLELNEGIHTLTLIRKTGSDLVGNSPIKATLSVKIYNPINGRPEEFKVLSCSPNALSLHQR